VTHTFALRRLVDPSVRPFTILLCAIFTLAVADRGGGRFLSLATAFSVMQLFATLGPVALGLGLSMLIREFDLSVAGMLSLAGCVAVLTGAGNPWLGAFFGVGVGIAGGTLQGLVMTGLRIRSVGVTLGGLLTFEGITHVLTRSQTIVYPNMGIALVLNEPILGVLSMRSAITVAVFLIAAVVMSLTRIGRDVVATGSDRRASRVAGVSTDSVVIGVFAVSGGLSALAGVLLSYSLAAASPIALSDVLVPASAAAIIGGVSLAGGRGRPLSIGAGVLILCLLRSGLNAVGASPYLHEIATGAVLLMVAVVDAPLLARRVRSWRRRLSSSQLRRDGATYLSPPASSG